MIDLHTPTLLLVILVVSSTLSATLASVARRFKRDGMLYWAWGFVLHTLTYVLFVLRGHVGDLVSVVLANTLLAVSFALISEGVQQFLQVRVVEVAGLGTGASGGRPLCIAGTCPDPHHPLED